MIGAEQRPALDEECAEPPRARRPHRQHQSRRCGSRDRRRGRARRPRRRHSRARPSSACSAACARPTRAASTGSLGVRPRRRRAAPPRRAGAAASRPGQTHLGEAVDRPGLDAERDREGAAPGARRPRCVTSRVVIAVGAQQLAQQLGVGPRAAVDLRGIGRLAAILLERRKLRGTAPAARSRPRCRALRCDSE